MRAVLLVLVAAAPVLAGPDLKAGAQAKDYNAAGRGILAGLGKLQAAFKATPLRLDAVLAPGFAGPVRGWSWTSVETRLPGVTVARGAPGAPAGTGPDGARRFLAALRAGMTRVDEALFKLDLLDAVEPGRAAARLRYEVVGRAGSTRCVERGTLRSRWIRTGEGEAARWRLTQLEPLRAERVRGPGLAFRDVARARGLESYGGEDPRFRPPSKALRYQVLRHAIGAAATADVDGDGWDDVLLSTGAGLRAFRNVLGRFVDMTKEWGLNRVAVPTAFLLADFDNDGDADLFVGRFYGANLLFENRDGRFRDVTADSGLLPDDMTAVLATADFDGDGRLDLYLGRFLDARVEVPDTMLYARNAAPNKLYLNRGRLRFEDVSRASGADDVGLTLGIGVADYDRDGDPDIYLSNDYGRNVLYRNRGDATFEDVTLATGTLAISGGMSSSWGDFDGDGRLDIYVSSIRSNQRWFSQDVNIRAYLLNLVQSRRRERLQRLFLDLRRHMGDDWAQVGHRSLAGNYLLRQRPDGTFDDVSDAAGVRPQGWYWSSGFFDVDNDGRLDVYAVNGWISGKQKDDL